MTWTMLSTRKIDPKLWQVAGVSSFPEPHLLNAAMGGLHRKVVQKRASNV